MNMLKTSILLLITSLFIGCASKPPAPVVNREPSKPVKPTKPKPPVVTATDSNATSHLVEKGDTLYAIGLRYGYGYKEIAAANNIPAPYNIQVGQTLVLPQREEVTDENGVVTTPIKTTSVETQPPSKVTPVLSEPQVFREPYSLEAMTRKTPPPKPVVIVAPEKPKTQPNQTGDKVAPKTSAWQWPAQGKVISYFKEASNKGIDIGGKKGQAIHAAAKGKVIYKGSDLRGYGNLVIVKHSKTYLSVYAHNSRITVKEGQFVGAGQKIAEMGDSDTNSVKLHFEIRHKGKSVDPMKYLPQN